VIAIIITIMVLQFKIPHGHNFSALRPLLPIFVSYVLSFIFVANYWNNHHYLLLAADKVNGGILWANAHLLFWLSLTPFATAWMGENFKHPVPVALYGALQLACAIAFTIFAKALVSHHGPDSLLASAIGSAKKEKISVLLYAIAVPLAFVGAWISFSLYVFVAGMWLIPDRRISRLIAKNV
jgi:uncharacterized membrane protein